MNKKHVKKYLIHKISGNYILLSYSNFRDIPNGCGDVYLTGVKVVAFTGENIEINEYKNKYREKKYKNDCFHLFIMLESDIERNTLKDVYDDDTAKLIFEVGSYE